MALRYLGFSLFGLAFTYLLAGISEYLRVTSFGFGVRYWADWLYPFYFLFAFCISGVIFRMPKRAYVGIFVSFAVLLALLTYLSQGQIFDNWRLFGVDAY